MVTTTSGSENVGSIYIYIGVVHTVEKDQSASSDVLCQLSFYILVWLLALKMQIQVTQFVIIDC